MGNASYRRKKKRKARKYDHFRHKEWDQIFRMMNLKHDVICDLYDMFGDIDVDGTGGVSCDEFLIFFSVDQTRAFAARLFDELDVDQSGEIDFLEFVVCVWNLCTLTSESIAKFLFELYDKDDSGSIEFVELAVMMSDMMGRRVDNRSKTQNAKIAANIKHEVSKMLMVIKEKSADLLIGDPEDEECALDHKGFEKMISLHFDLFAPVYDIQRVLRAKVLGLEFWRKQIKFRADNRMHHLMRTMPRKLQDMRNRENAMKIARAEYVATGNRLGLKRIIREEKRKMKEAAREEEERLREVERQRYEEELETENAGGPKARRNSTGAEVFKQLKAGNMGGVKRGLSRGLSRSLSMGSARRKKSAPISPKKGGQKGVGFAQDDEKGMKIMNAISSAGQDGESKGEESLDVLIARRKSIHEKSEKENGKQIAAKPKSGRQIHKEALANAQGTRIKRHDSTKLLVGL